MKFTILLEVIIIVVRPKLTRIMDSSSTILLESCILIWEYTVAVVQEYLKYHYQYLDTILCNFC